MFNARKQEMEARVKCSIKIQSCNDRLIISASSNAHDYKDRGHSMVLFHKDVSELLISHLNDSRTDGRLLYDLAKSADGSYKIERTLSGAVRQQSIAKKDGPLVWMQLIDIPFFVSEVHKQDMLAKLQNIRARYTFTYTFLGVSSLCDPYVLVYGQDPHKVEGAKNDVAAMINNTLILCR
jgi:hypothetical protein